MKITPQTKWQTIAALVESLIAKLEVEREYKVMVGGTESRVTKTRPMRFIEFSRGVGINNALAHRVIRGGVKPSANTRAKVVAWCEKNSENGK